MDSAVLLILHTDSQRNFMSKTFTHAGVSTLDGVTKARFCNDALRTKVLQKNGHTNIDIIELMNPMSKEDIVAYLISIDFAQGNATVQAALEQELDKRSLKMTTPKAKAAPKAKAPKAKAITLDSIAAKKVTKAEVTAQLADMEDAPY
jgi:hypothetical protein